MCQSDSGISGTYVPNMSRLDQSKWKGKLVGKRSGVLQVEIRKDTFVCIIALNGYNYKYYKKKPDRWGTSTTGKHIHIGASGPIQLTFKEWEEWGKVVQEAVEALIDNLKYEKFDGGFDNCISNTSNGFYNIHIVEKADGLKLYLINNGRKINHKFDCKDIEDAKNMIKIHILSSLKEGMAI